MYVVRCFIVLPLSAGFFMPCERAIHNLLQSWSVEGWEKQDIKFSLNEHSSALHNHSLMFKTA